jgi:hypothetical protein
MASQVGVNGVGYRADIVDIVEAPRASPENSLPESTVTILSD